MDNLNLDASAGAEASAKNPTTWTIMVYIAADGALANFAVESLKQLNESARMAGADQPKLVVGAQLAFPTGTTRLSSRSAKATGTKNKSHFLFKRDSGGNSDANEKIRNVLLNLADESETADKSQKDVLKDFLTSVYGDGECKADLYALILWGHGPELLLQPGVSNPINSSRMYITPEELREALDQSNSKIPKGASLAIVGFDACFMSMFEMACELKGRATYMVASQDDVPDASFPYDKLVKLFRKHGNKPELLLKEGVDAVCRHLQGLHLRQRHGNESGYPLRASTREVRQTQAGRRPPCIRPHGRTRQQRVPGPAHRGPPEITRLCQWLVR